MKRMIKASQSDYLAYFRIYEVEDGEEIECVETKADLDDAIKYARNYARDNEVDTHVVACPADEDDGEWRDYFEYTLQCHPYEIIWQSY